MISDCKCYQEAEGKWTEVCRKMHESAFESGDVKRVEEKLLEMRGNKEN